MKTRTLIVLIVLFGILLFLMLSVREVLTSRHEQAAGGTMLADATFYTCQDGKNITAVYTQGEVPPAVAPGMPPVPTGSVALDLSDGRSMTLPRTLSGSGIRYASANESVIFWSKGDTAFLVEDGRESYSGCVVATDSSAR